MKKIVTLLIVITTCFIGVSLGVFVGCKDSTNPSSYSYVVSINPNIKGAFNFDGNLEQLITPKNSKFEKVTVSTNKGYVFKHYEINGNKYFSNTIEIDKVKENTEILVVADYATYELPIINIDTNDEKINSKEDYTNMTFSITNCDDELEDVTGGIRLRGNSTMGFDKKPYRIKFDKKQSLFNLPQAKSWVLLADYLDPSCLHNYTAFKLGAELDNLNFTPTPNKVNVYLNGEFVGLYTLCEQVQENEGRIGIEMDEITEDMTALKDFNFFICMDYNAPDDPTAILNETYFYIEEHDKYVELKYPEKEQFVSNAQFNKFFSDLKIYVKDIMDAFYNKDVDKIKNETNIKSLIDFLIVDQMMGEIDHFRKSFNMYYTHTSENIDENNKLNFGPIWDYDWSLLTPWTGQPNESYYIDSSVCFSNLFFGAIDVVPEFKEMLKARYKNVGSKLLEETIAELFEYETQIEESLRLNHEKWYENFDRYITKKNVELLNMFLINRKIVLDSLYIE